MLWLALAVLVVAPLGGLAYAIVQGIGLWRAFRGFRSAFGKATGDLAARADAVASREPLEPGRLGESAERLRRSTAQLSILLNAFARVRTQWSGMLAVYPRK